MIGPILSIFLGVLAFFALAGGVSLYRLGLRGRVMRLTSVILSALAFFTLVGGVYFYWIGSAFICFDNCPPVSIASQQLLRLVAVALGPGLLLSFAAWILSLLYTRSQNRPPFYHRHHRNPGRRRSRRRANPVHHGRQLYPGRRIRPARGRASQQANLLRLAQRHPLCGHTAHYLAARLVHRGPAAPGEAAGMSAGWPRPHNEKVNQRCA